jgi:hypothetical protein
VADECANHDRGAEVRVVRHGDEHELGRSEREGGRGVGVDASETE